MDQEKQQGYTYSSTGEQPPPYNQANTGPYQQPYPAQPYPTGYGATTANMPPPNEPVYVTQVTHKRDGDLKGSIPIMPLWLAWLCFIFNCILPGIGTLIASFSVFCCADMNHHKKDKGSTFCLNFCVGWLQLLTLTFFFLGWIWSVMWGWLFVAYSIDFYGKQPVPVTRTVITTTQQPVYLQQQQQVHVTTVQPYPN